MRSARPAAAGGRCLLLGVLLCDAATQGLQAHTVKDVEDIVKEGMHSSRGSCK